MGGGDLNLKKSWHPHTIKNQEKVWKAEQAKTQEEKKLHDLRREMEEDKNREELKRVGRESGVLANSNDDNKLDWMYKNSTELINREEYLLGRKIDKSFEILQAEEKEKEQQNIVGVKKPLNHVEHECVPFSIRAYKNVGNSQQVDLQRKVMEDPLMLIKQREMESRRKILENPVKLKELHRILKTDEKLKKMSYKSKKSQKKMSKKSKKKRKKSTKYSSSPTNTSISESADSDLDLKLAKKFKSGIFNEESPGVGLNLSKLLELKFEKISQELDKATGKRNPKKHKKNNSKLIDSDISFSSDREKNYVSKKSSKLSKHEDTSRKCSTEKGSNNKEQKRIRPSALSNYSERRQERNFMSTLNTRYEYRSRKSRSASENRKHHSRSRSRVKTSRNKESTSPLNKHQSESRSCAEHKSREKAGSRLIAQSSKKLTDEEKQAKIKQMMSNAAWREEERSEAVKKYRETYAREEERYRTKEFDTNFVNKEVKKAMANQTSVESRLRANFKNIQRTSAAMNTNFARK